MIHSKHFRRPARPSNGRPSTRDARSRLDVARFELAATDPGMAPAGGEEDTLPIRLPIMPPQLRAGRERLAPREEAPDIRVEVSDGVPDELWSSEEVTDVDAGAAIERARQRGIA